MKTFLITALVLSFSQATWAISKKSKAKNLVKAAYQGILLRDATSDEQSELVEKMLDGDMFSVFKKTSRKLAKSKEFKNEVFKATGSRHSSPDQILSRIYQTFLRRCETNDEYNQKIKKIKKGKAATILRSIFKSEGYESAEGSIAKEGPPDYIASCSASPWEQIVEDSGMGTSSRAPLNGRFLGDNWGQFLEVPDAINSFVRSMNIVEINIKTYMFNEFFDSGMSVEDSLKSWSAPYGHYDGSPLDISVYDQLRIAEAVGLNIQINIDSTCDGDVPGQLKKYHVCGNPNTYSRATAPQVLSGHLNNLKTIYRETIKYLSSNFRNVSHVQIENEPCYLSYTGDQYVKVVKAVTPVIRSQNSKLKIIVGSAEDQCGSKAAQQNLDFDVLGFHYAIPPTGASNSEVAAHIASETKKYVSAYGNRYDIWLDEVGIGQVPHTAYSQAGSNRMTGMIRAAYDNGAKGVFFLIVGGSGKARESFQGSSYENKIYSSDKGESQTAKDLKVLSRQYGTSW